MLVRGRVLLVVVLKEAVVLSPVVQPRQALVLAPVAEALQALVQVPVEALRAVQHFAAQEPEGQVAALEPE